MTNKTTIQFVFGQENRESETFGPYDFVQLTYDALRDGPDGDRELATFRDGIWTTDDNRIWSDVIISAV